eukprot:TRINITY_DN1462_c0_g1_i1.p2 TRINITY_DN1462_c0_g1~~TRINITY_DN1462_c0_g1_i1.p2  ORF type:complete len:70 (+),score=7.09 TRINITY_DN1462_c0_g1_i1:109-318(+)
MVLDLVLLLVRLVCELEIFGTPTPETYSSARSNFGNVFCALCPMGELVEVELFGGELFEKWNSCDDVIG